MPTNAALISSNVSKAMTRAMPRSDALGFVFLSPIMEFS
jgi:hypothetical protein